MDSLPDVLFVVDVGHEHIAIHEAKKLGIPVVAVVDSNCSPEGVDYLIPGNDDAMRAIQLYAFGIADSVLDGKTAAPSVPAGEDEFVELDEEGKPKPRTGAPRRKPATAAKKKTAGRRVPVVDKAMVEGDVAITSVTADAADEEADAAETGRRTAKR
jgi:small subunit ribosomal protein S2